MSVAAAYSAWDKINSWMSPLGAMVDAVMRPVVAPLADMLDCVTGDSAEVRSTAQRWRDLAIVVERLENHHRDALAPLASAWEGSAYDAFRASMNEFLPQVQALATGSRETAEFLEDAAMEVELAEELVATIIRELIEWALLTLAVSAALAVVTFGASALAGSVAAAAEAAVAYSRIAAVLAKIASLLQKLTQMLRAVKAMSVFSREGFLIKSLLVKGLILKPVVSGATGLTGSPLGQGTQTFLAGGGGIAADEIDDQLAGLVAVQTPLRDRLDGVIAPAARAFGPVADELRPVSPVIDEIDRMVP